MKRTQGEIVVDVPASVAYEQWANLESFPRFMTAIDEVRRIDQTTFHWKMSGIGFEKDWDAVVTEQVPGRRLAWRATGDVVNAGAVTFEPEGPQRTKVRIEMEYEPEGARERIGDAIGAVKQLVGEDLKSFKEYVEHIDRDAA